MRLRLLEGIEMIANARGKKVVIELTLLEANALHILFGEGVAGLLHAGDPMEHESGMWESRQEYLAGIRLDREWKKVLGAIDKAHLNM
jgi:hypothetical protein